MVKIYEVRPPQLSLESFLKRYKNGRRRERLDPIYRTMLVEAERLSIPKAIYDEFSLAQVPDLSEWLLPDTTRVVLSLCTLGSSLESRINELSRNDLLSAVVLDEIALAYITAITRQIHDSIRSQTQTSGLKAGPAYRPGLGRWPLETQNTIFACLPADIIGITLSDHLLMTPTKSTSLIIPILARNRNHF